MDDPLAAPSKSLRILQSGWRLASAQVALFFAGGSVLLLAPLALLAPACSPRAPSAGALWTVTGAVVGGFALLAVLLRLSCRHVVVDRLAGVLRVPGAAEVPLADLALVAVVGRRGTAPAGSGRAYRYEVFHVLAVRRGVGGGGATDLARFPPARPPAPGPVALGPGGDERLADWLRTPPAGAAVLVVDAASRRRAERDGGRLAAALGVPFLVVEPVEDPRPPPG